ncbi:hypothetical protein GCM10009682_39180 [Luedemannella flava]|uniref:ABC transporter permease n=1 Tax=Luedemannella flava TaxID=349316 RepID=A0ABN2M918_9ACTN
MRRAFRAELIKLARPRLLTLAAVAAILFAVGSAAAGILNAQPASAHADGPVLDGFARADGGSLAFTMAASFAGAFLLAVFAGAVGVEFSRGTLRTLLLRQPDRHRLLAGKLGAVLAFAAVAVAVSLAASVAASVAFAGSRGLDVGVWFTGAGLRGMARDYGLVMLAVTGWALLGAAIGVLVPSLPVALAVGVGWAGPVEQVFGEAWGPATRWFPGLLLESLLDPDPGSPGSTRALVTLGCYCVVAVTAAVVVLRRRDVTS